ncbi:MAG: 1-deoxy-D-xylulose-5-phosphate reductoisomerase [Eubacteriales bacterium]|nr:1-deoxy-D-xylulose-5-phosphate reductoisomerase [Eubacteriales bacterium]MDY3332990.1 1-deoxy-D-xylulose-5-phosphate reductoisomerase [Gallibacter sp.]
MKKIGILGSTGSIGTQALSIIRNNPEKYKVSALTCGNNIELLIKQIDEFKPCMVCVSSEKNALLLKNKYKNIEVYFGDDGMNEVAKVDNYDIFLTSVVGFAGLKPTYSAIKRGKTIALANKETLVAGGELIMTAAKQYGAKILPVDSEHSAIFQSLLGTEKRFLNKILLTASGGPFRNYTLEQLRNVTLEQTLKHPNWNMGRKITVDSASMMNKGLELIEARWLFDVSPSNIDVLVHPQSVLHSAVEFTDGAVIGQMGIPDMAVPIAFAFSYPDRLENIAKPIDFINKYNNLTFEKLDEDVFVNLKLARQSIEKGGSYPIVLNASNEILVNAFLNKKISFIQIQEGVEKILNNHNPIYQLDNVDSIIEIDCDIRRKTKEYIKEIMEI